MRPVGDRKGKGADGDDAGMVDISCWTGWGNMEIATGCRLESEIRYQISEVGMTWL
jgi:hypothetical protein